LPWSLPPTRSSAIWSPSYRIFWVM